MSPAGDAADPAPAAARRPASPADLFRAFTRMSLMGFGGVLPIAQHELVEHQRWLTREEFVEYLSIGQILPGPNIVNVGLMVGDRFFGWRGAAAALAGMLGVPLLLVLALAMLYAGFADRPMVSGALRGMGVVAAGLVLATGWRLSRALRSNPLPLLGCVAIVGVVFALIGIARLPLLGVLLLVGGASVALAWWRLGR